MEDFISELEYFIALYYTKHEVPGYILVNKELNLELLSDMIGTKFETSIRGNKKKLLDMAYNNAKINLNNKFSIIEKDNIRTTLANKELSDLLGINIYRIDVLILIYLLILMDRVW